MVGSQLVPLTSVVLATLILTCNPSEGNCSVPEVGLCPVVECSGGITIPEVASVNAFSFTGLQEGLFSSKTAALLLPTGLTRYLPLLPFAQIQAEALATFRCPESREAWDSVVSDASKDQQSLPPFILWLGKPGRACSKYV